MKQLAQHSSAGFERHEVSDMPDYVLTNSLEQITHQADRSVWTSPEIGKFLAKTMESMVSAYLDVNLNVRNVQLKGFMDDLERNILLSCLRLTHGSQRNAAALLGLKPTALFEKMRKHGINGRQIKLTEKLQVLRPREQA
jgi:transcriptional regulator with GAF, ATPase, and Fis domain